MVIETELTELISLIGPQMWPRTLRKDQLFYSKYCTSSTL